MYARHPDVFSDHLDNEYLIMMVFVMHQKMIGDKSLWYPFWKIISLSDLPMRWDESELAEL